MAKVRITKEFGMEMSHALWNYDGSCRNVHGHSYKLFVTLAGIPIDDIDNPKNGMLLDFSDLKKIIKTEIIDNFDHALVIYDKANNEYIDKMRATFANILLVNYQPTCENLVSDFAMRIYNLLPGHVSLYSLKLYETATSYAEWFATDNP